MSEVALFTGSTLTRPGLLHGNRPERRLPRDGWLARQDARAQRIFRQFKYRSLARFRGISREIEAVRCHLEPMSDQALQLYLTRLKESLHRDGVTERLCIQAFGLVRTIMERTLGLQPYPEQLFGGWLLLHGYLAEMETGEGKTLTALFPAATFAMAGLPVHVITSNDYLVARDAKALEPAYEALGLSVGTVTAASNMASRHAAYQSDVAYVSNKQIVFDYLRDRQNCSARAGTLREKLGPLIGETQHAPLLRGLCYAIIDEADSVLIDDARTPLVLSQDQGKRPPSTNYAVGLGLARRLVADEDYQFHGGERSLSLTDRGEQRLGEMSQALKGGWSNVRYRREFVTQALSALHLFQRDQHYLVRDGQIVIVDENTGRPMPDRKLSHGVHQMVETKEGCAVSEELETLASISYQRFFRRYHRLAGMTGTAREVSAELDRVYGLPVIKVPPHRSSRRQIRPLKLHACSRSKVKALTDEVATEHRKGRPVLIGTRSVAESELVGHLLDAAGFVTRVLNANQDADEAEIIAGAGQRSSIVVATNMAGRGTDIPLGPGVAELGGLHVISTQLNDAARVDRQLLGRCARQGDPGSYAAIVSLEDDLVRDFYPTAMRHVLARAASNEGFLWKHLAPVIARLPQLARERQHLRLRTAVLSHDEHLEELLAFSGLRR